MYNYLYTIFNKNKTKKTLHQCTKVYNFFLFIELLVNPEADPGLFVGGFEMAHVRRARFALRRAPVSSPFSTLFFGAGWGMHPPP